EDEYPTESKEGRDSLMIISGERLKTISNFVKNNHIGLLRSPPSSGKSTLGQVLRDYFDSLNYDSIYISLAEISKRKEATYVFIDEIKSSIAMALYSFGMLLLGTYYPTLDPQMIPVEFHHALGLNGSLLFKIPKEVQKAVFNLTGRHLGIITTACAFYWFNDWNLTIEESEFIRKKLFACQTSIFFPANYLNPVAKKFVKIGLFSTVAHNNMVAHSIDSNEQIKISAPIIRFLLRTIERMSPSILSESFGKGAKSGPNSRLYERSWQMEWYCTATTAVPENTSISADIGPVFGSVGFLDFYVNGELCWGIELTHEGD
ncbi:12493_t:CDS:2, partial [Racocetra persica]